MNCEQEDNVIEYNGEAKKLFASPFFNCQAFVRSCQWQVLCIAMQLIEIIRKVKGN